MISKVYERICANRRIDIETAILVINSQLLGRDESCRETFVRYIFEGCLLHDAKIRKKKIYYPVTQASGSWMVF